MSAKAEGAASAGEVKYLSQEEIARLFKAGKQRPVRDLLLLAFAYRFAMRTRELIDLPARNVDLVRSEITIQAAKHGLRRTYSIPADLKSLIRRYVRDRDRSVSEFFTGRRGRLHRIRVFQIMKETMEAAGIPSDAGAMHLLRHSAAVHALDAGLSSDDVRDLCRHARISSTAVYANLSTKRRGNYLKVLAESDEIVKVR
jgi:site-specific recombinase XerD